MKHDNEGTKRWDARDARDAKAKDRKFPKMILRDLLKHSQDLCYLKDILVYKDNQVIICRDNKDNFQRDTD